jgi:NADH dehydrogenase
VPNQPQKNAELPHVVVVGGGFGGLALARSLRNEPVRVTVVDRTNHHLFQPLLYQVALAGLSPADIAVPIRSVLRRQSNTRVLMGEVTAVDLPAKTLKLHDGDVLIYDRLVLAMGARTNYFGHPEWARHAFGLKTLDDALDIRRRVLLTYEAAEREPDAKKRRELLTFVVIGAGPTGVELSGTLADLAKTLLAKDFRVVEPHAPRVVLVEAGERVLPSFDADVSAIAERQLRDLGVEIRTGSRVGDITDHGAWIGQEFLPSKSVIWAAGVEPAPLVRQLGADPGGVELDQHGRIVVGADLCVPNRPEIMVIGDIAHFDQDGAALPGLAGAAIQMGRHAAANIGRSARGEAMQPFRYRDRGIMAAIGRKQAVVQMPGLKAQGWLAIFLWLFIHLVLLVGFRNRYIVLSEWIYQYLTFHRGARLITGRGLVAHSPKEGLHAPRESSDSGAFAVQPLVTSPPSTSQP